MKVRGLAGGREGEKIECENCWVKQGTQHEAAIVARRIVCRINASHSRKWVGEAFNPANSCAG